MTNKPTDKNDSRLTSKMSQTDDWHWTCASTDCDKHTAWLHRLVRPVSSSIEVTELKISLPNLPEGQVLSILHGARFLPETD